MTQPVIQVVRLPHAEGLPLPAYATPGAAAMDVVAAVNEPEQIEPGERALILTGLCMALPEGYELQLRPRSGLALSQGITLTNSPGTIDQDYPYELGIIVHNLGHERFTVKRGDRICQAALAPVTRAQWQEVTELPKTARTGGFGSTGIGALPATAAPADPAPSSPPPPPRQKAPQEAFNEWFVGRYPLPGLLHEESLTGVAQAAWIAAVAYCASIKEAPPAEGRFVSPCPPPNPRQRELVTALVEECAEVALELAEVQQRATKLLRFGVREVQPGQPWNNAERLSFEVGDLLEVLDLLQRDGLLLAPWIAEGRARKRKQLAKFLQVMPVAPARTTGECDLCQAERPGATMVDAAGRVMCSDCLAGGAP